MCGFCVQGVQGSALSVCVLPQIVRNRIFSACLDSDDAVKDVQISDRSIEYEILMVAIIIRVCWFVSGMKFEGEEKEK